MIGHLNEEFIKETGKRFQEDTEFLTQQGWKKIEKTELGGEKVFSVWIHPETSEEYGHQNCLLQSNSWQSAIDRAEYDLIKELGWEEFVIIKHYPQIKKFRREGGEYGYFIHPKTRRAYHYLEAIYIARFCDNDDTDRPTCQMTKEIQAILDEQKIDPKFDMRLHVKFLKPEGKDKNEYSFEKLE